MADDAKDREHRDEDVDDVTDRPDSETLYDRMEPLEPYTTGELASLLDIPRQFARTLLDSLNERDDIRKKEPEPDRVIWIREPPATEWPACGHRFEIKFLHPVLSSVQFCPQCGQQL